MKDEVKEILDYLETGRRWSYFNDIAYKMLTVEERNRLLDYITNLQTIEQQYSALLSENAELENKITNLQDKIKQYEDPEDLTLFHMWLDEKAKDKMKQLQEENKRLKEIIKENTILVKDENGNYQELNINLLSLQDRIKELEQINEEHHRINGELRKENEELKEVLDKIKEKLNQYEFISGYYDDNYDGEDTTYSHDTLKEDILNLLEGIE